MATPERKLFERGLRREVALERKAKARSPISMGRRVEADIDTNTLPARETRSLRITQADVTAGRADADDIGKFWFTEGYSLAGGPDVVRPGS